MAKAKKLPSGQWRTLVYSHTEKIRQSDGTVKDKRIYESFTADTRKESEFMSAEFSLTKKKVTTSKMTIYEAIDKYIEQYESILSPTSISGYRTTQKYGFQEIMNIPLNKINNDILQNAINLECTRPSQSTRSKGKPVSSKTVNNEFGLISTVIRKYNKSFDMDVKLPEIEIRVNELSLPDEIFNMVQGTDIELPVLLAMWLSFTMSELKGLTKSGSIKGNLIFVDQVTVTVGGKEIDKKTAKNRNRNRVLVIPEYIMGLINQVEGDRIIVKSGKAIANSYTRMLERNGLPHMSFHDLRHVNASVMAILNIPDKYAMERGGWKTDKIMKGTYMQTFRPERAAVDAKIDEYFNDKLFGNNPDKLQQKYISWLNLFDKKDNEKSREEFKKFIKCNTKCNT